MIIIKLIVIINSCKKKIVIVARSHTNLTPFRIFFGKIFGGI